MQDIQKVAYNHIKANSPITGTSWKLGSARSGQSPNEASSIICTYNNHSTSHFKLLGIANVALRTGLAVFELV